jgi:hypothetical protein
VRTNPEYLKFSTLASQNVGDYLESYLCESRTFSIEPAHEFGASHVKVAKVGSPRTVTMCALLVSSAQSAPRVGNSEGLHATGEG